MEFLQTAHKFWIAETGNSTVDTGLNRLYAVGTVVAAALAAQRFGARDVGGGLYMAASIIYAVDEADDPNLAAVSLVGCGVFMGMFLYLGSFASQRVKDAVQWGIGASHGVWYQQVAPRLQQGVQAGWKAVQQLSGDPTGRWAARTVGGALLGGSLLYRVWAKYPPGRSQAKTAMQHNTRRLAQVGTLLSLLSLIPTFWMRAAPKTTLNFWNARSGATLAFAGLWYVRRSGRSGKFQAGTVAAALLYIGSFVPQAQIERLRGMWQAALQAR